MGVITGKHLLGLQWELWTDSCTVLRMLPWHMPPAISASHHCYPGGLTGGQIPQRGPRWTDLLCCPSTLLRTAPRLPDWGPDAGVSMPPLTLSLIDHHWVGYASDYSFHETLEGTEMIKKRNRGRSPSYPLKIGKYSLNFHIVCVHSFSSAFLFIVCSIGKLPLMLLAT